MLTHSLQKTELHKQNNKLELPKWFSQQLESEHETIFFYLITASQKSEKATKPIDKNYSN